MTSLLLGAPGLPPSVPRPTLRRQTNSSACRDWTQSARAQPASVRISDPSRMRARLVSRRGQQNDFILLSLVRTKAVGHIRDVRRLVVAVSRSCASTATAEPSHVPDHATRRCPTQTGGLGCTSSADANSSSRVSSCAPPSRSCSCYPTSCSFYPPSATRRVALQKTCLSMAASP